MKKFLVVLLCFGLVGCVSIEERNAIGDRVYNYMVNKKKMLVKVYDYSYDDVYSAITNLLERRLKLRVNRKYTTKEIIWSEGSSFINSYSYLFQLRMIDSTHTEVTLKASGTELSISDKDMVNKYLPEELAYLDKIK